MAENVSELVIKLIDSVSEPARIASGAIRGITNDVTKASVNFESFSRRATKGFNDAIAGRTKQHWPPRGAAFAHEYRPDVDGLRAIAVSAVIAYHFYNDLLPGGFLGVDMFFVISGYVITASLAKQTHNSIRSLFLNFYSRRIKRILPALVVCVVATCLFGALFINPHSQAYSSSMTAGFFSLFGLSNIYFFREATDYFGSSIQLNLFTLPGNSRR